MDDFKREIYINVLETIKRNYKVYEFINLSLCSNLQNSLFELGAQYADIDLKEFFPEFYSLWDGYQWRGLNCYDRSFFSSEAIYWWDKEDIAPRIRILEYLLNR